MKTVTPQKGSGTHFSSRSHAVEEKFFSPQNTNEPPFFSPQTTPHSSKDSEATDEELDSGTPDLKHTDLAVPQPNPTAVPKVLTDAEVQSAISYNTTRFTDAEQVKLIRDVMGLSHDAPTIDEAFVKKVAEWQAKNNLAVVDGKINEATAAVIGFEVLEESKLVPSLKPAAISILEKGITITASGDSYADTATESRKAIKFTVKVPNGLNRDDYVLVNWAKGHMKTGSGGFFKVKMYDVEGDANWPAFQVDSVDTDPLYWSTAASRRNYNNEGTDGFSATDNPGPALNTETGADYDINFKMEVYRLSDMPATTSGNLGGAESKVIATYFWNYKVSVSAAGAFSH